MEVDQAMPSAAQARSKTEEIPEIVAGLRRTFRTGRTRHIDWRRQQLRRFKQMMEEREEVFMEALRADLGKSQFESWLGETGFVQAELDYALKHLSSWMKPEKVGTPLVNQPGKSRVVREPLGVTLIIGAWNYPVQLVLSPLVAAISAGNTAVVKPSEVASHASAALAEWIPKYLDPDCVQVVEGGIPETQALLEQKWDYIFYTGGGKVGRIIMQAAAKNLTPVTLELGGKSPCVVDRNVDLDTAARRIVWGKWFNAGQTCVAPDYVLVPEDMEQPLLAKLKSTLRDFYGDDPQKSPDYGRIINERHFERLSGLLEDGEVVVGGQTDPSERYIAPTILRRVNGESKVMEDEIFGPVLPVLTVKDLDEAIDFINDRSKPLALYVYSKDKDTVERVLDHTSSGGVCVNDCMAHLGVPELPFGGVGESGMGAYHGKHGFETFSHRKAVLDKSTLMDPSLRYPPYDANKLKWARKLM